MSKSVSILTLTSMLLLMMFSLVFSETQQSYRPDVIKIWTDEIMDPDPGQVSATTGLPCRYGQKSAPGSETLVRWCVNTEDNSFMLYEESAAAGPYAMKLRMYPSGGNNCWMDIHRDGAADGWNTPLDVSGTARVTFWIKADSGTHPVWFYAEAWSPSSLLESNPDYNAGLTNKQKSANIFIDGSLVIREDEFGDFSVMRDEHFNGMWQYVSMPWTFLQMSDSLELATLVPWSLAWEGSSDDAEGDSSSFDHTYLRTIKWHTKPENNSLRAAYKAAVPTYLDSTWTIDDIVFTKKADGVYPPTALDGNYDPKIPNDYELGNAYPNPFNPMTNIEFKLPVSNKVTVVIYNIMGQKVRTLVNDFRVSGTHKLRWNGRNEMGQKVSTGMYFVRMNASHFSSVKKIVLIK